MSPRRVVVITGPVGAGKSSLAVALAKNHEGARIRTHELLLRRAEATGTDLPRERQAMQAYGEELDRETDGRWVTEEVSRIAEDAEDEGPLVVDSVRLAVQVQRLRERFGAAVVHVHVTAPEPVLERRYAERGGATGLAELSSYAEVRANPTESAVDGLRRGADIVVDTARDTAEGAYTRVASRLALFANRDERLVDVLVGGQYGSEGKGNIAFHLAPEYDVLVRVGGPNAGHRVPLPEPYTHRLLPSGTRAGHAELVIGPGATVAVDVLLREIADCGVTGDRLAIDPQVLVVEPEDRAAEAALVGGIGSTGQGGGSAAARRITGRHGDGLPVRLGKDVPELRPFLRPAHEVLDRAFARGRRVLLEGTQGTALSIYHGDYPHVTSRDTTTAGALAEAGIGVHRVRRVVLVARTYPIRVGGPSGPMAREISWDEVARRSGVPLSELEAGERGSVSGTARRVGEFDWRMLRRSAEVNGATDVALTFADYLDARNREADRYEELTPDTVAFAEEVERVAGVPVSLVAARFDARGVIDRREW